MPIMSSNNTIYNDIQELLPADINVASLTKHDLVKWYKLDLDVCKSRSNRNCSGNHRCIKGLGQSSWLTTNENKEEKEGDCLSNLKPHFRGLVNLGATCYLNTFLQLWYHNVTLRNAIYNWRPNNPLENVHQNPIMSLQLVLSLMQFSKRPAVDPTPFIKCLKLDESQEQDIHEFSNLFISYTHKKLYEEHDKSIHDMISQQYSMKIAYIIKCRVCNFISERESDFYELLLSVKGYKDIDECIDAYLKEESLEGSNKYQCQVCNCLQDADRYVEIRKLPPVLNLQLLRFEAQNGHSRKISSFIKFPNKLNMGKFVKTDVSISSYNYNLFAVLIHEGQTANSGHYITFIKKGNIWYKFNDEIVERLKDFNLKIDSDDDDVIEIESKSEKGYHDSKNAYMLVYRQECDSNLDSNHQVIQSPSEILPNYLSEIIEKDNEAFLKEQEQILLEKSLRRANESLHQGQVKQIYANIEVPIDAINYDVISKDWLVKLFEADISSDVNPVDNNSLLCTHSKLDMNSSFKCISSESANLIYSFYSGGPRIKIPDFFCYSCTANKINFIRTKDQLNRDSKTITTLLKFKCADNEKMYWIGKESFKKWKQMKLNIITKQFFQCEKDNEYVENDIVKFNHDLLCEHGNLCSDESKRRLIRQVVWNILLKYFSDAPHFEEDAPLCSDCLEIDKNNQIIRDKNLNLAISQRSSLSSLFSSQKCLNWSNLLPGQLYHILSVQFYNSWKKFLAHPNTSKLPNSILNGNILCEDHHLFLFPPLENEFIGFDKKYIILTDEEWNKLTTFYSFSVNITILKFDGSIVTNPEFCEFCFKNYTKEEALKRLNYSNASIFIHTVVYNDEESVDNSDSSGCDTIKKFKKSQDFMESSPEPLSNNNTNTGNNNLIETINFDVPRRSLRRRRLKSDFEIKVSSTDKLKDIKFKIMQQFRVATYDQSLIFKDKQLFSQHNNLTLAELEIEPYSVINLNVDSAVGNNGDDVNCNESVSQSNGQNEGGFKGTKLVL